jgi:hypothetical protein
VQSVPEAGEETELVIVALSFSPFAVDGSDEHFGVLHAKRIDLGAVLPGRRQDCVRPRIGQVAAGRLSCVVVSGSNASSSRTTAARKRDQVPRLWSISSSALV